MSRLPIVAVLPILLPCAAWAGEDVHGARTGAMGRAAAADPADNSAVTVNPSLLGLQERYDGDVQLRVGATDLIAIGGSAVDSRTAAPVAFGITYLFDKSNPPITDAELPGWVPIDEEVTNFQNTHQIGVGLAVPVLDRKLSFGVSGAVLIYDLEHGGAGVAHDYDVGMAFAPISALSFGVTGRNLVPFPDVPVDLDPSVLGGASLHGDPGALAVDVERVLTANPASPLSVRVGGELAPGAGRLRAGFRYEGAGDTWFTWGLGAENAQSAIEYTMGVPLGGVGAFGDILHQLGLRLRT